jgi:putative tricarboxylic transport membrane protein
MSGQGVSPVKPDQAGFLDLSSLLRRQDFIGGIIIIAVAAFAYWLGSGLSIGSLGGMGPGLLPKALSVLLAVLGLLLLISSLREAGEQVTMGSLRGPLFVLGALVAFGLAVRPLGLVAAGPLAILVAAFGSDEVKWLETIVSSILTTVFCIALFKLALGLPIPLAPWLLGY